MVNLPHALRRAALAIAIGLAASLAAPVQNATAAGASSTLQAQYQQAQAAAEQAGKRRFVLVGAAMDASSTAFIGDVQLAERQFRNQVPGLLTLHLANGRQRKGWPEVTPRSLQQAFERAGRLVAGDAAAGSMVVVLLSSHGHVGLMSSARYAGDGSDVHVSELREWLKPLGNTTPTLLILSSCYSGSLIPLLEQPNRIIITAASDRTSSFGCEPDSHNTYFIEALLGPGLDPSLSIEQWFERSAKAVAEREAAMKLAPPSAPQLWIGDAVKALARKPLGEVLAPFNAPPGGRSATK